MDSLQKLRQSMLVRFTQTDYHREMALIAVLEQATQETEMNCLFAVARTKGLESMLGEATSSGC